MLLSYCVVNTNGRDCLLACLDAIERTHPEGVESEVLVLDNASDDGSAEAVRGRGLRLVALDRRDGKAANDSRLLGEARGRYCLLLNEDSELHPGATRALLDALEADPAAAAAGAQLFTSEGRPKACAWRFPGLGWALAGALFLHDRYAVQSRGDTVREVGWTQSSAMLVRREAAERVGFLDPAFFVYSDETDFCKRLHDAGWRVLYVPAARATHHDQLSTDRDAMRRRIVEFHRGRDRYMRKHAPVATRVAWRTLWAWSYLLRALAALVLPRRHPARYWRHAMQELAPGRGEGVREAAEAHNRRLRATPPSGTPFGGPKATKRAG
ncbi:MAG TPA: glycosyltransferase family 2 protein [Thermoleophilaceae bacterium]|nr:glycosyltransferase family 2 protein [Thermoleophilaceae bacterium]